VDEVEWLPTHLRTPEDVGREVMDPGEIEDLIGIRLDPTRGEGAKGEGDQPPGAGAPGRACRHHGRSPREVGAGGSAGAGLPSARLVAAVAETGSFGNMSAHKFQVIWIGLFTSSVLLVECRNVREDAAGTAAATPWAPAVARSQRGSVSRTLAAVSVSD